MNVVNEMVWEIGPEPELQKNSSLWNWLRSALGFQDIMLEVALASLTCLLLHS